MKKYIIFFIIIIATLGMLSYIYAQAKISKNQTILNNNEYAKLYNNSISGNDLATLINKTINKNEQNNVEKDEKSYFIENDTNSIKIDVKFNESDNIYKMESIYKNNIAAFINLYSLESFKCTKIEYHNKTKNLKYLYFEQI